MWASWASLLQPTDSRPVNTAITPTANDVDVQPAATHNPVTATVIAAVGPR